MPSTMGNVENIIEAATTVEHITLDKDLDEDNKYNIIKKMNGNGGTVINMEGGELFTHTRCKGNDDVYAKAANAYNAEKKCCGKVKHMAAAATTHNDKEIVEGASKGFNLPPLGNQYMTIGADGHGAPPLCVPYIESIAGFYFKFETKEEGENSLLSGQNLQAPPILGELFMGAARYTFNAQMVGG